MYNRSERVAFDSFGNPIIREVPGITESNEFNYPYVSNSKEVVFDYRDGHDEPVNAHEDLSDEMHILPYFNGSENRESMAHASRFGDNLSYEKPYFNGSENRESMAHASRFDGGRRRRNNKKRSESRKPKNTSNLSGKEKSEPNEDFPSDMFEEEQIKEIAKDIIIKHPEALLSPKEAENQIEKYLKKISEELTPSVGKIAVGVAASIAAVATVMGAVELIQHELHSETPFYKSLKAIIGMIIGDAKDGSVDAIKFLTDATTEAQKSLSAFSASLPSVEQKAATTYEAIKNMAHTIMGTLSKETIINLGRSITDRLRPAKNSILSAHQMDEGKDPDNLPSSASGFGVFDDIKNFISRNKKAIALGSLGTLAGVSGIYHGHKGLSRAFAPKAPTHDGFNELLPPGVGNLPSWVPGYRTHGGAVNAVNFHENLSDSLKGYLNANKKKIGLAAIEQIPNAHKLLNKLHDLMPKKLGGRVRKNRNSKSASQKGNVRAIKLDGNTIGGMQKELKKMIDKELLTPAELKEAKKIPVANDVAEAADKDKKIDEIADIADVEITPNEKNTILNKFKNFFVELGEGIKRHKGKIIIGSLAAAAVGGLIFANMRHQARLMQEERDQMGDIYDKSPETSGNSIIRQIEDDGKKAAAVIVKLSDPNPLPSETSSEIIADNEFEGYATEEDKNEAPSYAVAMPKLEEYARLDRTSSQWENNENLVELMRMRDNTYYVPPGKDIKLIEPFIKIHNPDAVVYTRPSGRPKNEERDIYRLAKQRLSAIGLGFKEKSDLLMRIIQKPSAGRFQFQPVVIPQNDTSVLGSLKRMYPMLKDIYDVSTTLAKVAVAVGLGFDHELIHPAREYQKLLIHKDILNKNSDMVGGRKRNPKGYMQSDIDYLIDMHTRRFINDTSSEKDYINSMRRIRIDHDGDKRYKLRGKPVSVEGKIKHILNRVMRGGAVIRRKAEIGKKEVEKSGVLSEKTAEEIARELKREIDEEARILESKQNKNEKEKQAYLLSQQPWFNNLGSLLGLLPAAFLMYNEYKKRNPVSIVGRAYTAAISDSSNLKPAYAGKKSKKSTKKSSKSKSKKGTKKGTKKSEKGYGFEDSENRKLRASGVQKEQKIINTKKLMSKLHKKMRGTGFEDSTNQKLRGCGSTGLTSQNGQSEQSFTHNMANPFSRDDGSFDEELYEEEIRKDRINAPCMSENRMVRMQNKQDHNRMWPQPFITANLE